MPQPLRRVREWIFWAFCAIALLIVALPCFAIIVDVARQSLPVLRPSLFLQTTDKQGIQNAVLGTLLLGLGVFIIGGALGIGSGIYLSEFAPPRRGGVLRFFSEVLAGVPSIVVGYVGYVALVVGLHWGYSLLAATWALSVIVVPYIAKSTELALRQVPRTLREGATALGLPQSTMLRRVLLPPAFSGIFTGLLVAVAIATSETAPLLYTLGFTNANPSLQLVQRPMAYLTYVVFTDVQLPDQTSHQLASAAALVSLVLLLILVLGGRLVARRGHELSSRMGL